MQDEQLEAEENPGKKDEVQSTCIYKYEKNGKIHKKGEICGKPVAKHPETKDGERYCAAHQPDTGDAHNKCQTTYFRDGEEKQCHGNVANENDQHCDKCVRKKLLQEEKEKQRHAKIKKKIEKSKNKCIRKLLKGDRAGKLCNKVCAENTLFCNDCMKTKDGKKLLEEQENMNDESDRDADEEDESDEGDESNGTNDNSGGAQDDEKTVALLPLNLALMQSIVAGKRGVHEQIAKLPVAPHWKYIIELLLVVKESQPGELAAVLFWFANGRYKCESYHDKHYWELSSDGQWRKIPISVRINVAALKEQLTREVLQILSKINGQQNASLVERIRARIVSTMAAISVATFDRFIALLIQNHELQHGDTKKEHEDDVIEFIKECLLRSSDRKQAAVTTTQILDKFNEWLQRKGRALYPSGAQHFGRLLSHVNQGNSRWGVVKGAVTKHLVAFKQ